MVGDQPPETPPTSATNFVTPEDQVVGARTDSSTPPGRKRLIERLAQFLLSRAATFDPETFEYVRQLYSERRTSEGANVIIEASSGVLVFFLALPFITWPLFWAVTNITHHGVTILYIWTLKGHRVWYFAPFLIGFLVFVAVYVLAYAWLAIYLARRDKPIPVWASAFVTFWLLVSLTSVFAEIYYGSTLGEWGPDHVRHIDAIYITFGLLTTAGTGHFTPYGLLATAAVTTQMVLDAVLLTVVVSLVLSAFSKREHSA
jgi:hypothetical protein